MRSSRFLALTVALTIVCAPIAAGAGTRKKDVPGTVVVAAPAGIVTGYITSEMILPQGTTLQLFNPDPLTPHDVRSRDTKKVKVGPNKFEKVPLFQSVQAGTGSVVPVDGTEKLKPGEYKFYCGLHPQKMKGTLTVQ